MHGRSPYRFNRIMPIVIGMLIGFLAVNGTRAQDEDTVVEALAPPVEDYQADDDYNNAGEELPPTFREVSDSTVNRLKRQEEFEYANDDEYLAKPGRPGSDSASSQSSGSTDSWQGFYNFFSNPAVKVVFYILLIGFFLFVIYRIIVVNNLYFTRSSKRLRTNDGPAEEDINDEHIDDKIRKAAHARDYRNAVRYLYLKGLRLLNDKGWIRYHAQATNHDYVYQVSQYPVAGDFRFLTRVYDYVWYGEFAVNDEQFNRLQSDFQRFYQDLKK